MLTAIGRAAAQRLVLRAAPLAAVPRSQPVVVRTAARRGFSTTQWPRLAARASTTKATPKAKKAAAPTKKATPAKKAAPAKKKAAKPKKAVAKKTGRSKKPLTPEEKLKADLREWKKGALLDEPKPLPSSAWVLHTQQELGGKSVGRDRLAEYMREAAQKYKNFSSYELQRLQEKANENALASNAAFKAWVESHPPIEVYNANILRKRIRNATGKKKPAPIHDERLPKRPQSAYVLFSQARFASGDFDGIRPAEAAPTIAEQWRNIPQSEKSTYEDLSKAAFDRYSREMDSVLGRTAPA